jgi:hypothetical protein
MIPIVGWSISKLQLDGFRAPRARVQPGSAPQLTRRFTESVEERVIESADAPESRRHRDVGDAQGRLVQQLFRKMKPTRLGDHDGRDTDVLHEQSVEMSSTQPETGREILHGPGIQAPLLDEPKCPPHDRRGTLPCRTPWSHFRSASTTRPIPRCRRCRGRRVVTNVGLLGPWRGANGPAIDARRGDCDEELAVESRVAADARTIERRFAESGDAIHDGHATRAVQARLAIFGHHSRGSASRPAVRVPGVRGHIGPAVDPRIC